MKSETLIGENIIYFGNDWNADNKTSSHHIAERLSIKNRLLYVESPGLRRPRGSSRDFKRVIQKFIKWIKGPKKIHSNLYVLPLFLLPFHSKPKIRKLNEFLMTRTLKRACNKLDFQEPILWVLLPHITPVISKINRKMIVHWCHDNYESMPGVDHDPIAAMEQELIQKSDVIFAVNTRLCSKIKPTNANVYFIPHGVDITQFNKAINSELPIPEDIKDIPHPVIGFFGLIEEWIDQDLIAFLAKSRPSWSFVFIGRAAVDTMRISSFSNLYLLGPRPYSEMPAYAKGFDVATIPFVVNELTLDSNPLKLREYLAAGRAVVSTPLPEICKYEPIVQIAKTYEEFVEKIEFALKTNGPEQIQKRIEAVAHESWESRVEDISKIVQSHLQNRGKSKSTNPP
jgi:glycosyltransferase involved in cell wall biosynthesis